MALSTFCCWKHTKKRVELAGKNYLISYILIEIAFLAFLLRTITTAEHEERASEWGRDSFNSNNHLDRWSLDSSSGRRHFAQ